MNILAIWLLSRLVLLQCLLAQLGVLLFTTTLKGEWYVVIKAYDYTIIEIVSNFLVYWLSALSLHTHTTH